MAKCSHLRPEKRARFLVFACLVALWGFLFSASKGHGQAPSEGTPTPPSEGAEVAPTTPPTPRIAAPRLVAGACRTDLAPTGRVVLLLTIDAAGVVTDAVIESSLDPRVDEAALADARAFVFAPATRDDVPMAVRIRFACEFRGAAASEPAAPTHTEAPPETPAPEPEAPPAPTPPAGEVVDPAIELDVDEEALLGVRAVALTEAARLAQSAESVDIVSMDTARRESADLGEVVARERGTSIRRSGGLGSDARISLAGLTDDQIRFFIDGVPMEMMGFVNGLANFPVNMLDHIEIYRGILPIRFGADALGGAFNLAPQAHARGTNASLSVELGSFGTYRLVGTAEHRAAESGLYARATGFFDTSDNDYQVDVDVADETGRITRDRVRRFHDGYRAGGGIVEVGFIDTPFATRLVLRAFATTYDKALQNNVVMSVPYGEPEYGATSYGASLRYEHAPRENVRVNAVGGYAYTVTDFLDVGQYVYNWYGERIYERSQPGEIDTEPYDQSSYQHSGYVRATTDFEVRPGHVLRLGLAPTVTSRTGVDRTILEGGRDPLAAERLLATMVTGLEYEATLFEDALHVIGFVKDYVYAARSIETLPGNVTANRDRNRHAVGGGLSLRYRVAPFMTVEAGYERATRLPRADEVFGNGVLINANLELEPEVSHNANVELGLRSTGGDLGAFTLDTRFTMRLPDELIVLLGNDRFFRYQNVYAATGLGTEVAASWVSPGDYVTLGSNVTYTSYRNRSDQGPFSAYEGDRIPNRPWLFVNGSVRVDLRSLLVDGDELSFGYYIRYVHWFFRGWESVGRRDSKQRIPRQTTQTVSMTYAVPVGRISVVSNVEVQNLGDADTFDFFGVQRPGRAFYFKVGVSH